MTNKAASILSFPAGPRVLQAARCLGALSLAAVSVGAAQPPPKSDLLIEPVFAPKDELTIKAGQNDDQGRVEFLGRLGRAASAKRTGDQVVVRIPTRARPDIGHIGADPPPGVAQANLRDAGNAYELVFQLKAGANAKFGRDESGLFLVFTPAPLEPEQKAAAAVPGNGSPAPADGVVPVLADESLQGRYGLKFEWRAPLGAAVFQRGKYVWIVFDAAADLRLPGKADQMGPLRDLKWSRGPDFTALRIEAPAAAVVTAQVDGPVWEVVFADPGAPPPPILAKPASPILINRDDQTGPAALVAALAGAKKVVWIRDPAIGDRLAVVPALGPLKYVKTDRKTIEAELPTTYQGLVVQAAASDLDVAVDGDLVRVSRPKGMTLSNLEVADARDKLPPGVPEPAPSPGLVMFDAWSQTGSGGFLPRYAQLQDLAAADLAEGGENKTSGRFALARFLVGSELGYEAVGVTDLMAKQSPKVLSEGEFRALRGAAKAMLGRYKEALADLTSPAISVDANAALWRSYALSKSGQWADARKEFLAGEGVLGQTPPRWRARFAATAAEAALQAGDTALALRAARYATKQDAPPLDRLAGYLVLARVFEKTGDTDRALRVYEAVEGCSYGALSAPATLRAVKLKLDKGMITSEQASDALSALRFRWRGDATEVEIMRTLADVYLAHGRYREALETLRGAGKTLGDSPEVQGLRQDLSNTFRALFLDGLADGLQPIEALGLFNDFKDLTPPGADGDEIVRRLVRRLVDVDLLARAAELLQYQVENRLDGVAKSEVAADLATIYMMDHKPELALQALWSSRTSLLPTAMNERRKVLEARALADLNRYDHAIEVLGPDQAPDAQDVRAEIAWRQKAWAQAGPLFEKRLGDRWKDPRPLSGEEETRLIRAGISFSLANDGVSLKRLAQHFNGFIDGARAPEAMRVALAGLDGGDISPSDFSKAAAQADSFAGWVEDMKKRLREERKPIVAAAPAGKNKRG